MKKLLIAGCGDLGERLARRLDPKHWQVHGLRRNPSCLPAGIVPIGADLLAPDSLQSVRGDWDGIIYQATPAGRTAEAYEAAYIKGLSNLLDQTHTARLIFVSSTGVYGQDDGAWVDEDAETRPSSFSGRILCAAEQIAHDHGGLVVRFSGIYGPGREYLIRSVQSGRARCRETPPQWTNRIHALEQHGSGAGPAVLVHGRQGHRCRFGNPGLFGALEAFLKAGQHGGVHRWNHDSNSRYPER